MSKAIFNESNIDFYNKHLVVEFKKTTKGYYYLNKRRVAKKTFYHYSDLCTSKDTFFNCNAYSYFSGWISKYYYSALSELFNGKLI